MQSELAKLGQTMEIKANIQIAYNICDGLILNFEALKVEIGKTIYAVGIRANLS